MYITRSLDRDNDPIYLRRRLATYRAQLNLAHHDIDRLFAESEATLRLLLTMIEGGHINAAREIIRRRLGETP